MGLGRLLYGEKDQGGECCHNLRTAEYSVLGKMAYKCVIDENITVF